VLTLAYIILLLIPPHSNIQAPFYQTHHHRRPQHLIYWRVLISDFPSSLDVSSPIRDQFNAPSSYELNDGDYRKVTPSHQPHKSKCGRRRPRLVPEPSLRRIGGMSQSFFALYMTMSNTTSRTGICTRLTRLSPITTRLYNQNLRFQACIHVQPSLDPTMSPIVL
jgi:hypothetical protein